MTKIPSVEESVAKFQKEFWKISGKSAPDLDRKQDEYITQALTEQRTALLTELRKVLASEGVLSMSVEKALVEIIT